MKLFMLAVPAVAALSFGALAQTESGTMATDGSDAGATFGTGWSSSVGTTFIDNANPGELRSAEDISTGWQSLTQEDRDLVLADCKAFMEAHGTETSADAATAGAGTTATDDASAAASDTAATSSGDVATDTTTQADAGAATTNAGYDMVQMKAICEAAQGL